MIIFHTWITIEPSFDEGRLISLLVNHGYDVSPAAEDNSLILKSKENAIVACKLTKQGINTARELYSELYDLLVSAKINYYALIISEHSHNAIWNCGVAAGQNNKTIDKNYKVN